MQHKFKIGSREFLAVGVPVNNYEYRIELYSGRFQFLYNSGMSQEHAKVFLFKDFGGVKNYPTSMEILFEWPNCTEEQAASVVEKEECEGHVFYKNYGYVKNFSQKTLISSLSSLASKMKSEGIIGSDKYLILEITTR